MDDTGPELFLFLRISIPAPCWVSAASAQLETGIIACSTCWFVTPLVLSGGTCWVIYVGSNKSRRRVWYRHRGVHSLLKQQTKKISSVPVLSHTTMIIRGNWKENVFSHCSHTRGWVQLWANGWTPMLVCCGNPAQITHLQNTPDSHSINWWSQYFPSVYFKCMRIT